MQLVIEDVCAALHGKITHDDKGRRVIRCPGPGHSRNDLSLSVWVSDDEPDGFGVYSFSDQDQDPIVVKDWVRAQIGAPAFKPNGKANGHANGKANGHAPAGEIVAKYLYQDALGEPVQQVSRTRAKQFFQQRPDGHGGWEWGGIPTALKVPFRLPETIEASGLGKTIFICEGEKACLALHTRGYPATCSPGGAGKWPPHFAQWFKDARVIILPDNDQVGLDHAEKVAANLTGVAAEVMIRQLPGLPKGGDVYDFLAAGGDPATIADLPAGPPPRGRTAAELWNMSFPPIRFAVPLYIAEGLTLLAGAPKRGKSWLALDVCVTVAIGGYTLGDQPCVEGDVLYCALEDSPRRMKERLRTFCQLAKRPPQRLTIWFANDLPRLGDGCEEALREWIGSVPSPRLIVIDTLNYIRPERVRDEDPYAYDYRCAISLQRLASEVGIAIVVIHHTRKSVADDYLESVSGTNGLTGGSDAVIVLERQSDGGTVFKGRGRDIEEFELAARFDKDECRWKIAGNADETRQSETKQKILRHLREAGWFLTPAEIASQTGLRKSVVDQRLFHMLKAGEVRRVGRGKYGLPETEVEGGRDQGDGDD
ncbi:MAG TPA: AAA family ATPase [Caulobacteraceae bacterium]